MTRLHGAWILFLCAASAQGSEPMATTGHTNRLSTETSPYLLQHARNPVDWYPWGPEAFEAARRLDRPIFLSIGYSTCYWCHVMERESFEDEATAAIMNEHFVSIKVDREERPDVDEIYMAATQIFNRGQGGWPMSLFLEPETLKPFIAGTYFPPTDGLGRPGFPGLLTRIAELWAAERDGVLRQSDHLAALVARQLAAAGEPQPVGRANVEQAVSLLLSIYDDEDAGFGRGTTKFPMPAYLDFLMGAAWDRPDARAAVLHTLNRMATGGMYDQVGGGFHRYSTDSRWLVPHFEKMLYDNGQLASTYAAAYERTGDAFYAEIVRETLDWVLREMTDPAGGFRSAQDAEVDAREGGNYLWVADEVRSALQGAGLADQVEIALAAYGFGAGTNFRDPHHPEDGWKNVVHLVDRPEVLARSRGIPLDDLNARLVRINEALLAVRDRRRQPATDDKVLAGWNGLMIAGMADGGRVLGEPHYVEAARRAAGFILETMQDGESGLLRVYRAGTARVSAMFEDYALLIRGLVALHRATGEERWLEEAARLAREAKARFGDDGGGAYFDTLPGQTDLFVRTKTTYDGAVPSGNAVMLNNLLDLHELTGDESWLAEFRSALGGVSGAVAESPVSAILSTLALSRSLARDGGAAAAQPAAARAGAVRLETSADAVELAEGETAALNVTLHIAEPYHVNAHEPGQAILIGLEIRLAGGSGVRVRPSYPPGELYRGEIRIHRGTITIPITLERTGEVVGEPRLTVTYQVCTDELCLTPATVIVPVEITAAP